MVLLRVTSLIAGTCFGPKVTIRIAGALLGHFIHVQVVNVSCVILRIKRCQSKSLSNGNKDSSFRLSPDSNLRIRARTWMMTSFFSHKKATSNNQRWVVCWTFSFTQWCHKEIGVAFIIQGGAGFTINYTVACCVRFIVTAFNRSCIWPHWCAGRLIWCFWGWNNCEHAVQHDGKHNEWGCLHLNHFSVEIDFLLVQK